MTSLEASVILGVVVLHLAACIIAFCLGMAWGRRAIL